MFTLDDARRYLLNLMPPGFEDLYDLTPGVGDVYQLFDAMGAFFKSYAFDILDKFRTELFPQTVVEKAPDWEAALGISNLAPALFGNTAQRQQAIVAKLREVGPFCDPLVTSVLQPLLGYFPTTPVQILKCSRAGLDLAHKFDGGVLNSPHGVVTQSRTLRTTLGGLISRAGVRLYVNLGAFLPTDATTLIGLQCPDKSIKTFVIPAGTTTTNFQFFIPEFAGKIATGGIGWNLQVFTSSPTTDLSISGWHFIVDTIGPGMETGGAIFAWGVYADPLHLGESGVPPDFTAARNAIARITHSEGDGALILAIAPNPDDPLAIPDAFIPGG